MRAFDVLGKKTQNIPRELHQHQQEFQQLHAELWEVARKAAKDHPELIDEHSELE